jgi:plastocyanin
MNHFTVSISSKMNVVFAALVLLFSSSSMSFGQDICPGADVEVATQSFSYSPATLVVDAGTTVGWVNFGGTHDVNGIASSITGAAYNNPESFSLGTMSGNASGVCLGTFIFTVPGVYNYDCSIGSHAANGMVAAVSVAALVVLGCTDSSACNYDQTATDDDDSCVFVGDACEECNTIGVIQEDCSCGEKSTSSADELEALSVLIFPNPVTATLTINLNKKSTLQVFDAVGKLVEETGAVASWVLNVSDWEKGLYTVQTQAGTTHKFIVE